MKKIKTNKLNLNKQTVSNLGNVKGGLTDPLTNTYCNGNPCSIACGGGGGTESRMGGCNGTLKFACPTIAAVCTTFNTVLTCGC